MTARAILRSALILVVGLGAVQWLMGEWRVDALQRADVRERLFAEIQPVTLANCGLARFGEANDGGYLVCGNLLSGVHSAYSYGINGYDGWGCEVSTRVGVPVHEYDCFDTRAPSCPAGQLIFHPECVASAPRTENGRVFATMEQQIANNGDRMRHLVVKMDVEGAEWESLESAPPDILDRVDQLVLELHGVDDERFVRVIQKLKASFHVAHLHFNNYGCRERLHPFPSDAYEVLLVNKRLGLVDLTRTPSRPHSLDAPNDPRQADCQ